MAEPAKCPRCKGYALEPEHFPAKPCGACNGTGRAAAPPQTQELLNG